MLTSTGYQQMDMCSSRPRTAKHLTERKRRARINDSLLQLKSMVFPVIKKDIARHPKMEKADILEMTVRYLKDVQTPTQQGESNGNGGVTNYHAGFTECLSEVSTFMSSCENIDIETRLRLLGHLADRCSTINEPDQKPDVSRLQPAQTQRVQSPVTVPQQQQQQTRVAPSPVSIPATSPVVQPQQFATTHNGMVLLLPAHAVQPNPVISIRVPFNEGVLTPPQSPISPEPSMTRFTPSPVDIKPSKTALDTRHHRFAPYQKHAVKSAEKSMWRPW